MIQTYHNIVAAIRNEYMITTHGDRFLLHDSGPGDDSRIILFATDDDLETLRSPDHWFGDGTFEVSPSIFFCHIQYILYAMNKLCLVSLRWCQIKHRERMVDYLGEITQHMQGHIPTEFLLDFEKAAMNSAEINFNGVDIKGCFFHLCSNIWKKIRNS